MLISAARDKFHTARKKRRSALQHNARVLLPQLDRYGQLAISFLTRDYSRRCRTA